MRATLILLLVLGTLPSAARAGDGIVVESYAGSRPADADEVMAPMLEELAARGFVTGAAAASGLPDDFDAQIERGHRLLALPRGSL